MIAVPYHPAAKDVEVEATAAHLSILLLIYIYRDLQQAQRYDPICDVIIRARHVTPETRQQKLAKKGSDSSGATALVASPDGRIQTIRPQLHNPCASS